MPYDWSIAEREIFTQRFGSMSAQELRKILFAVYSSAEANPTEPPSDYEIGRALGLTATQVKNLRVGANLLLSNEEQTLALVGESLKRSIQRTLIDYQESKRRIVLQVNDPVALNHLSYMLVTHDVFHDCDISNGHIAVPALHFIEILKVVFPAIDEDALEEKLNGLVPDYAHFAKGREGSLGERLAGLLAASGNAGSVMSGLASCVSLFI